MGLVREWLNWWLGEEPRAAAQGGSYSGSGYDFRKWFEPKNIFLGQIGNTLATTETIFAAVSLLSNAMASLPLKLYQDYTPVRNRLGDLIANEPNPNMTSFDFIRTLETHRDSAGNAYALKEYDNAFRVVALWPLDPTRVTPVIHPETRELWYQIDGDQGRYNVHNMDMIHVRHIYPGVDYKGISPFDVLKNSINFDRSVREFTLDTLDSSIKASFILRMATHLSDEKKQQILDNFAAFYSDRSGVLIQEAGTTIDLIKREFMDTRVFEVERITVRRVAQVYNIPVHMLAETEGTSYSSNEQLMLEFLQLTLAPIVRQYEQEFNRKLLTPQDRRNGLGFKFALNALLRADMKTRGEFYFKGVRSGVFEPNEIRAWEELPPRLGGDRLFVSRDLVPIDQIDQVGQPQEGVQGGE